MSDVVLSMVSCIALTEAEATIFPACTVLSATRSPAFTTPLPAAKVTSLVTLGKQSKLER